MKFNFINRISIILFSAVLVLSCSSDLDFDQVNDFTLEPVFVANLAYFNVTADKIDDYGGQIPPDVEEFDVFRNKFFNNNLVKAELNFEIENTINRTFDIDLKLIDINNQTLETIKLNVPKYTGSSNIIKYPAEIFDEERLNLLKKTVKIGFVVTTAAEPGSEAISGSLKLKSGAIVYMKIK